MHTNNPAYEAFLQSATTSTMVLRYEAAKREGEALAGALAAMLKVNPKGVSSASYRASAGAIVGAIRRILSREPGRSPVSHIPQGEREVLLAELHLAVTLSLTALERFKERYFLWSERGGEWYWHTSDRPVFVNGVPPAPLRALFREEDGEGRR